jgi:hypothetical protein
MMGCHASGDTEQRHKEKEIESVGVFSSRNEIALSGVRACADFQTVAGDAVIG